MRLLLTSLLLAACAEFPALPDGSAPGEDAGLTDGAVRPPPPDGDATPQPTPDGSTMRTPDAARMAREDVGPEVDAGPSCEGSGCLPNAPENLPNPWDDTHGVTGVALSEHPTEGVAVVWDHQAEGRPQQVRWRTVGRGAALGLPAPLALPELAEIGNRSMPTLAWSPARDRLGLAWYLERDGGEYRFVEIDPDSGEVDTDWTTSNVPGLASAGLALAPTRDEWALVRIGRNQTAGVVHLPQEQTVNVCNDDCGNLAVESVAITAPATRDYVGAAWAGEDGVRVRLFESGGNRVETVDDGEDGPVRALGVAALPGDSNQVVVVWSDDSGVRSAAFSAGGMRQLRLDCEPADMLAVAASPSEVLVLSVHGEQVRLRRIDRASMQASPARVLESLGEIASPTLAWVGGYYAAAWVEDGRVRFFEAESGCAL